jgi:hypothetical protein
MTEQDVIAGLLDECREDYVGLWQLVNASQLDMGAAGPDETRQRTLDLVRRLLSEPGIVVGHPAPDGRHFVPWNLKPDDAFDRIEREWSALGRNPDIGEIAWFTKVD